MRTDYCGQEGFFPPQSSTCKRSDYLLTVSISNGWEGLRQRGCQRTEQRGLGGRRKHLSNF